MFPRVRVPLSFLGNGIAAMESGPRSGLYPPGFGRGTPRLGPHTPDGGQTATRMAAVRNMSGDWGQQVQGQLRAQASNHQDTDPSNEWLPSGTGRRQNEAIQSALGSENAIFAGSLNETPNGGRNSWPSDLSAMGCVAAQSGPQRHTNSAPGAIRSDASYEE